MSDGKTFDAETSCEFLGGRRMGLAKESRRVLAISDETGETDGALEGALLVRDLLLTCGEESERNSADVDREGSWDVDGLGGDGHAIDESPSGLDHAN